MYNPKLTRVDRYETPTKGLPRWAVYVRNVMVAGPFTTREDARERRRLLVR